MASTFHPIPYAKPFLPIVQQVQLLSNRGMLISDPSSAAACLERIGYYRLSAYWYPFLQRNLHTPPGQQVGSVRLSEDFRSGTTFQQAMELYVFDKKLRLLLLDAIERVEIALRVDIALLLGSRSPWAHRDPSFLHGNFTKKVNPRTGTTKHHDWLQRLDESFRRSQEEFVQHFKLKYQGHPPIWIAIELWDFGMLSYLVDGMQFADRNQLAGKYNLPRAELLTTWLRNINHIRNICAHHGRLWNRSPADQPSPPKAGEVPLLDHLVHDLRAQTRIYSTVAILQYFLRSIHPTSSWGNRLKSHVVTFPDVYGIHISQAGFPPGWEHLQLWM